MPACNQCTCSFPVNGVRHGAPAFAKVPFDGQDWPLCLEHLGWLSDNMPLPNLARLVPILCPHRER